MRKVIKVDQPPEGLLYFPDFISAEEEAFLVEKVLPEIEYYDFVLQGVAAKRKVKHYGFGYEFYSPSVTETEPFPDWLKSLRDRVAPLAEIDPERMEQSLVAYYPTGAGIGWHRDAPPFGPTVCGISFGSDDVMRFRREEAGAFEMYKRPLAKGSLYIMSGPARSIWQHSIAPIKGVRYSITFRTVREKFKTTA